MITSIDNNQTNNVIKNVLKFNSNSSLDNVVIDPQPVVSFNIKAGNNSFVTHTSILKYLWENEYTEIMIKKNHMEPF